MISSRINVILIAAFTLFICGDCSKKPGSENPPPPPPPPPTPVVNEVDVWMTRGDQGALLQKQTGILGFASSANSAGQTISVDSTTGFQSIDGFGYTLTGGSALLMKNMGATQRAALINDVFGNGSSSIGVNYLRISIGASDLSPSVFTYDEMPAGQTDPTLANFNLAPDEAELIPVLKEILLVNPNLKIMGTPWTAPTWMKDNKSFVGGSLLPQYYSAYANYFVKYIQQMQAKGITIHSVTIQNEPQHGGNNPSMLMSSSQQADFIKNHLGPAFQAASISTKIIIWDHNADNPNYPIAILNDPAAKVFIDGSAFHLYGGDISALTTVHTAHPDKNLYFTEQWTSGDGSFDGDFKWHMKNVIIGSMRNWSKVAMEWNLASDPSFDPHTPGGCDKCKGAITINASSSTKNVAYYIIGQISKFVPPGSIRIPSNLANNLPNVAFRRPDGKKVLIVLNEGSAALNFNIAYKSRYAYTTLPAGAAATYVW